MTKNISFSIIIPVYGVEKYIAQCAETLFNQTYSDIQFVFVNDGTKDRSIIILQSLIDTKYPHLKDRIVIVNKENGGLPAARRTGLEYATGDYILHVDSDDWLETDAVRKIAECAVKTGADLIYFSHIKEYGSRTSKSRGRNYTAENKLRMIADMFNYKTHGYCWSKCAKRILYKDNPILFPKYGMHEDICLMSQIIFYAKSLVFLDDYLYHYRKDNPGSISVQATKNRRRDSAMNMLDLYYYFRNDLNNSPLRYCYGEILFRAAWLSMRYDFDFFSKYDYLASDLRAISPSFSYKTFILWQLFVKLKVLRQV